MNQFISHIFRQPLTAHHRAHRSGMLSFNILAVLRLSTRGSTRPMVRGLDQVDNARSSLPSGGDGNSKRHHAISAGGKPA